jgi:hypothetical protein
MLFLIQRSPPKALPVCLEGEAAKGAGEVYARSHLESLGLAMVDRDVL